MGATVLPFPVGFEKVACIKCRLEFALPIAVVERLKQTHATFFCPGCGHRMQFER